MRLGIFKTKFASLQVNRSDALPENLRDSVLEVTDMRVDGKRRRCGHGSALMDLVCAHADAAGVVLILRVGGFDGCLMTDMQLEQWYRRLGFEVFQDEPRLMARPPQQSQVLRSV